MLHVVLGTLTIVLLLGQAAPSSAVKGKGVAAKVPAVEMIPTPELSIEQGKIRGLVQGEVVTYKGIPYATPPIGELRWKAPEPPAKWDGVRDCFEFGAACPQNFIPVAAAIPMAAVKSFSEDCLTLNVYRPANSTKEKLPVMVWIHGGGYVEGAASQGLYEGSELAKRGIVLVTINYRLGAFGFLAHPALSEESKQNISGNYGILDQIQALRWVQRNIAAFGGDPDCVTVFGESAGGGSVICLMVSPLAKGLFHRAIAQSAPEMTLRDLKKETIGRPSGEETGKEIVAKCGVGSNVDASGLRQVSVEKLVDAFPGPKVIGQDISLANAQLPTGPYVDGVVIPEDPNVALAAGRYHKVPLMIGNTRDEAVLFLLMVRLPTKREHYENVIAKEFGELADRILAVYPPAAEANAIRKTSIHLMTDLIFGAQARNTALHSAHAGQNTYKYLFSRAARVMNVSAAFHGCDVFYVFGRDLMLREEWDKKLSQMTQQYWVNFAATGDPNGAGLPAWPTYQETTEQTLELGDKVTVIDKYRHDSIDVMNKYLQGRGK